MASRGISRQKTDVIGECIEKLHEKRRGVREEGMTALVAALQGFVPADDIDGRYFTVFDRCCNSLRKGGAAEAALAYRAIGLLALSVGAAAATDVDAECSKPKDILYKALPLLRKTLEEPSSGAATTVAALDCLAAAARRPLDATPALRNAMGVIRLAGDGATHPKEVLTAAVSTFALVLTIIGDGGDYLRAGAKPRKMVAGVKIN